MVLPRIGHCCDVYLNGAVLSRRNDAKHRYLQTGYLLVFPEYSEYHIIKVLIRFECNKNNEKYDLLVEIILI